MTLFWMLECNSGEMEELCTYCRVVVSPDGVPALEEVGVSPDGDPATGVPTFDELCLWVLMRNGEPAGNE